jgi:hypothetical protein
MNKWMKEITTNKFPNYRCTTNNFGGSINSQGPTIFEKNSENAFSPRKWLNQKTNGTIRKCSSRAFQRMVMSVCFDNLKFVGQFLCPALGDRSRHPISVLKGLILPVSYFFYTNNWCYISTYSLTARVAIWRSSKNQIKNRLRSQRIVYNLIITWKVQFLKSWNVTACVTVRMNEKWDNK